jgi:hypothetical protein
MQAGQKQPVDAFLAGLDLQQYAVRQQAIGLRASDCCCHLQIPRAYVGHPRVADGETPHPMPLARIAEDFSMTHMELTQTDIAEWIESLLPPELWGRYCHLSYGQMARVSELAKYAERLREAEKEWYRACRIRHH